MKIVIKLAQHQLTAKAMVAAGLDPRAMSILPGKRRHVDRKKAAARGLCKHKARHFD